MQVDVRSVRELADQVLVGNGAAPKDASIVTICKAGKHSGWAAMFLTPGKQR